MLFPEPPPKGRSCWMCANARPVVQLEERNGWEPGTSKKVRGFYALCFTCLARWFPDRSDGWVADWLTRQAQQQARMAARKPQRYRQSRFAAWR